MPLFPTSSGRCFSAWNLRCGEQLPGAEFVLPHSVHRPPGCRWLQAGPFISAHIVGDLGLNEHMTALVKLLVK